MNERALEKRTELQGLSTAILLPSINLFGERGRMALGPLTQIVGIGLFQRTVLTLQRAGIRQLIVVAGLEEEQLKQALIKGPRVTVPVRWMPIREFPLDDPRTWESLAAEVHGFALVSGVGTVFSPPLIERLRREVQEGQALVVTQDSSDQSFELTFCKNGGTADFIVLPAAVLSEAGRMAGESGTLPISRWLQRGVMDGRVRPLMTAEPSHWWQPVLTAADVRRAEQRLYSSLEGEFEGFIDRYFNRKLSRWFTRAFLGLGLSPNAITIVATAVGLSAAAAFGVGTYAMGVAAALLFQLSAVIDCCDGEVARLTFTESPFGAWLDITMDNVVHMAIFGGIAIGTYLNGSSGDPAWIALALGAAAILGNLLSFVLVSKAQKIRAAHEWKTPVHAAWSEFMLKNVASRDFSVVVLLFAVLDKLHWFLWMAAAGSMVFAGIMIWVMRPSAISSSS